MNITEQTTLTTNTSHSMNNTNEFNLHLTLAGFLIVVLTIMAGFSHWTRSFPSSHSEKPKSTVQATHVVKEQPSIGCDKQKCIVQVTEGVHLRQSSFSTVYLTNTLEHPLVRIMEEQKAKVMKAIMRSYHGQVSSTVTPEL